MSTSAVTYNDYDISHTGSNKIQELFTNGYTVLKDVFDKETVEDSRKLILDNLSLFKNTRPTPSALHLAGFHRYPALEPLHTLITGNNIIQSFLMSVADGKDFRSIGLSDITINRSQCWHKDLLRKRFRKYLDDEALSWGNNDAGVYKALFYLQPGSGLKIIKGSHLEKISLEDDTYSDPTDDSEVASVPVEAGDIVIMDIRASHSGSDEDVFRSDEYVRNPKILVSTCLGRNDSKLTKAMEVGNFHRLMDWVERNP